MSDTLFDEMVSDNSKENVQMKSGEITGDQHLFHSLPKEFQTWHTTYYLLEKEGALDINAISKSQLNAYFWKVVLNASMYGIIAFLLIVHVAVVERSFNNILITFLDLLIYFGAALYVAFQFYFFGIIRAQVIGPVTETAYINTSQTYIRTFFATFLAAILMFVMILSFGESIMELIFRILTITWYKYGGELPFVTDYFFQLGIILHNFIATLLYDYNSVFDNIYFIILSLAAIQSAMILIVERSAYSSTRKEILEEIRKDKLRKKYPIERAQEIITAWRAVKKI